MNVTWLCGTGQWITRLPGPWTCNWSRWPHWNDPHPLEAVLSTRYAIDNEPLQPVMFNSFLGTTVFACPKTRTFYLHGPPRYGDSELETHASFPPSKTLSKKPTGTRWSESFPPPSGTFMYQPRQHETPYRLRFRDAYRIRKWPQISDMHLPEPWSCDWSRFVGSVDWYFLEQDVAAKQYGRDLAGFVPALYVPMGPFRGDTVMCPPGGAGTYYLWHNENRNRAGPWGPWTGDMQRFEGAYGSLEHFVRTADWNQLEGVPYREPVSYDD
ncbi:hypothetical protein DFH06DRAFT_1340143 [Mycena polygramma]|nr:hypothetical protein DFH06DRAFT_1340143 [Mycena polygramma]